MCGIVGYMGCEAWGEGQLRAMMDAVSHRGPDDEGLFLDPGHGAGLGHRRLAILDLTPAGRQPMRGPSGDSWVVHNGEVYNFLEIRRDLEGRGFVFRSDTDTEVILAAWQQWGEDAFLRFNGMWALALYDARSGRLVLCRDRYGVKPLYYFWDGRRLVFGSEYKALWAVARDLGLTWDMRGLKTALLEPFQLEASGRTLLQDVRDLPPGHLLRLERDRLEIRPWWRTLDHLRAVPERLEEQAEELAALLEDACRLRLRSDVPLAASLSGGLDSSSVVSTSAALLRRDAALARVPAGSLRVFLHAFPGTFQDESDDAKLAARHAGVEACTVTARPEEYGALLDRVLWDAEAIFAGMLDGPWRVYREQRRSGRVVSLDGHGADDMLGGYWWHPPAALEDRSLLSAEFWRTLRLEREMLGDVAPPLFYLRRMACRIPGLRAAVSWLGRVGGWGPLDRVAVPSFLSAEAAAVAAWPGRSTPLPARFGHLDDALYQDFHHRVLPRILRNFDAVSMAHGVEVRVPFLDYRLVSFVFSLPATSKIGQGFSKLVLRRAVAGRIPEQLRVARKKLGFTSPVAAWLLREMRPWVEDCLESPRYESSLIDKAGLRRFYRRKLSAGNFGWGEALQFWKYLNALKLTAMARERGMGPA